MTISESNQNFNGILVEWVDAPVFDQVTQISIFKCHNLM